MDRNPLGPERTNASYQVDVVQSAVGTSRGVKGPSLFSQLRLYQPLESTNIDYMHTLLEGVVKRLFGIWFSKTGALARSKLELVNTRLINLRPPSFVTSPPRSIHLWKRWRAHEYLTFLLYYSLPVMFGVLSEECFSNLIKLVVSVEHLIKKNILLTELSEIKNLLFEFY